MPTNINATHHPAPITHHLPPIVSSPGLHIPSPHHWGLVWREQTNYDNTPLVNNARRVRKLMKSGANHNFWKCSGGWGAARARAQAGPVWLSPVSPGLGGAGVAVGGICVCLAWVSRA